MSFFLGQQHFAYVGMLPALLRVSLKALLGPYFLGEVALGGAP